MGERIGERRVTMVASDGILTSKSVPRSIRATKTNLVIAFNLSIHTRLSLHQLTRPSSGGSTRTRGTLSGSRQVGEHHELELSSFADEDIGQPGWVPIKYVGLPSHALWFTLLLDPYFNSFTHNASTTRRNNRPDCPSSKANAI